MLIRIRHLVKVSLPAIALAAIAVAGVPEVRAQSAAEPGRVVVGGDFTLEAGQLLLGELTTVGADVRLAPGSHVAGRVNAVGGRLVVAGDVSGVIHVYGGELVLTETARVQGSVYTDWADTTIADGAVVTETLATGAAPAIRFQLPAGTDDLGDAVARVASPSTIGGMLTQSLALGLFAALVALIAPAQLERISRRGTVEPWRCMVVGSTIALTATVGLAVVALTIVGIPVALAGALLVALTAAFGWAALGLVLGRWLMRAVGFDGARSLQAALGTFAIALAVSALSHATPIGGLAQLAVSLIALGAIATSRPRTAERQRTRGSQPGQPAGA